MKKFIYVTLAVVLILSSCKKNYLPDQIYVAGVVVSRTTNLPVANVGVDLREVHGFMTIGGIEIKRVETDSSGRYSFSFSPKETGVYYLTFDKADYSAHQENIDTKKVIHMINVNLYESQF